MTSVFCESKTLVTIEWQNSEQVTCSRHVHEGERLFVGSDEGSDIRIVGESVASTHCAISAQEGQVTVRDCFSPCGTFVHDNRIRECPITASTEVRVGNAVISLLLTQRSVPDTKAPAEPLTADQPIASVDQSANVSEFELVSQSAQDLQQQLDQATAENEILRDRLAASQDQQPSPGGDPWQEEMIELLRAEVIELQTTLAEQQRSTTAVVDDAQNGNGDSDTLTRDDAEKLVGRLEELLGELQERDEQVAMLTELLEAAEEASRAAAEERTQLATWMQEIEERFGYREQEWRAQRHNLQAELDQLAAARDRAERALCADASNVRLEAAQKVIVDLRELSESQKQQIRILEARNEQLQSEQKPRAENREEQLRLSEERAEIARQRQELEASRHRTQRTDPDEATLKLQALRQHLKEIHQQEQKQQEERKLSSRLARLWSRLDGRTGS